MNFEHIICKNGECSYVKNAINTAAEKLCVSVSSDDEAKCGAEIVIGDTSREITAKARETLAKKVEENRAFI